MFERFTNRVKKVLDLAKEQKMLKYKFLRIVCLTIASLGIMLTSAYSQSVSITSPESGVSVSQGRTLEISVNYQSEKSISKLTLSVDQDVVASAEITPPSTSGIYTFSLDTGGISVGSHTVTVVAYTTKVGVGHLIVVGRDNIRINITPPLVEVEDLLRKLQANYSLIQDMKAKTTSSCKLDSKTFGEVDHSILHFKAPDKMKIVAYATEEMKEIDNIVIISGQKMYAIQKGMEEFEEVDLLKETGLTSAQFSQMDLCYKTDEFINNHNLEMDEKNSDLSKSIYAIDAIPKTSNALYSKLKLFIDYEKGLLVKYKVYKGENLREAMEVKKCKKIDNLAWLPTSILTTAFISSGNFETIEKYTETELNIGIPDSEFEPRVE